MTSILSETFAPPMTATNGRSGLADRRAKVAQLLLHQQPGASLGHQSHHRFDRRVRAMRRAERVVHVDIAQRGQLLREAGIVLLFFGVVAKVLEQHDAAGGCAAHGGLGRGTDAVFGKRDRTAQQLTRFARRPGGDSCPDSACPWVGPDARRGSRIPRPRRARI